MLKRVRSVSKTIFNTANCFDIGGIVICLWLINHFQYTGNISGSLENYFMDTAGNECDKFISSVLFEL